MGSRYTEEEYFNNGFNKLLGMKLVEVENGRAVISMEVKPEHFNPAGIVHGGVLFSLADSAAANAAVSYGNKVVTVNSDIKYLRAVTNKTKVLTATAKELKHGKNICFYEVVIQNDEKEDVAYVSLSYINLQG